MAAAAALASAHFASSSSGIAAQATFITLPFSTSKRVNIDHGRLGELDEANVEIGDDRLDLKPADCRLASRTSTALVKGDKFVLFTENYLSG